VCRHTFIIFNTYCFSAATEAARTRLNVTLCVHYLSFYFCFVTVFHLLSRLLSETFIHNYSSVISATGHELGQFKAMGGKGRNRFLFPTHLKLSQVSVQQALKEKVTGAWSWPLMVTTVSICGDKTQYPSKFSLYVTEQTNLHIFTLFYFVITFGGLQDASCSSQDGGSFRTINICVFS
jgi:hypothetical protein